MKKQMKKSMKKDMKKMKKSMPMRETRFMGCLDESNTSFKKVKRGTR